MKQPQVTVGILSRDVIKFRFDGVFSTGDTSVVTGPQEARLSDSGLAIVWNGKSYNSLDFEPASYDGNSFEIEGVTIGVDFHWEREENQRFKGALRLIISNGKITAINLIGVEDYLVSVISSEMKSTSSLPLLRAHSVISRSWLLAQMESRNEKVSKKYRAGSDKAGNGEIIRWWDHEDHKDFDVCADDHCQRYQGISRIDTHVAAGAVSDTRGQVLMYEGKLCDARFSKCCGGVFELFESCWDDTPHPYLTVRRDDVDSSTYPDLTKEENVREWILSRPTSFCSTTDGRILNQVLNNYDLERRDFYRWTEEISQDKIVDLLKSRSDISVGKVIDLQPVERGTSGRIVRLRVVGTLGEVVIGKELMIRRSLSESHLLSSAFVVERHYGESDVIPTSFTLHGAGWGHGVGLCQIGAAVMGERGYGYEEILSHYYPGAKLQKMY